MLEKLCQSTDSTHTSFQTLDPSLQNSIKNIVKKENYVQYNLTVKKINTSGNNFLGKLYEIDVIGETDECEKSTYIFVKESFVLKQINFFSAPKLYYNEEFIYKELSRIFTFLQDQANVPYEDRYRIAKAYDETNVNAIILENLTKRGFKTYQKMETVPTKYFELAVQELAKFHGLSFVVENKMPVYFDKKIKVLDNPFNFDEDWNELMRKVCMHVAQLYDDEVKQKIEKFVPVFLEKFPKYNNAQTTTICTLTYGDYKKNNVLVREKDGEPVEVIPVDYQFIDYGCPIRDLLLFIFSGSDQEFRRKHLKHLKELYFETLSKYLRYFDMDVESVYPRKEFETVWSEWLDYGLMTVLFAAPVVFAPETGVDFQNMTLAELPYCPNKFFEDIIRDLIDDFIQWGYL